MQQSDPHVFQVHSVYPGLEVRAVGEMPVLPPDLDEAIEQLWQAAAARVVADGGPALFNGRVFSADMITPELITGHVTEFRRVVAQMEQPGLLPVLGLRPLAVCGVLHCTDGIVAGRRPASAIYQAGMWQLPPAGSVDVGALRPGGWVDIRAHMLTELSEELGIGSASVSAPNPVCVVEHYGSHVSDLGMAMTTSLDAKAIAAAHASGGNAEYDVLRVIALTEMSTFVAEAGKWLVPSATIYLQRLGYL